MCTSVCFKSTIISVLIARSHSDDNHVNATAPCMPCTRIHMHFAQARPPMSCIPLHIDLEIQMVFIVHFLCIDGVWMQGLSYWIPYSYPHLFLTVRVGPCCQEVLSHLLVTIAACSPQWCLTILQRMCVSIVKVSEVSCHKVMNMSNMLREYNTVHGYKACIPKQCATILYSVCVVQFLSHGSWHLSNIVQIPR